jgi:tetratricopeptide (TPR) repeat protein
MAQLTLDEAMQLAARHVAAGELAPAEQLCRLVLEQVPRHGQALQLLGMIALRCGQKEAAVELMERGAEAAGQSAEAQRNLGEVYRVVGRFDGALAALRRAVELEPHDAEARHCIALVYEKQGRMEEAMMEYRRVLELAPGHDGANLNLGVLLERRGEHERALGHFERALATRPDYPEARMARAGSWLRRGMYEAGWRDYEWRWRTREFAARRADPRAPLWDGSDLAGRRILVRWEQGMGDTLQFVRLVPLVARRGGRVILEVQGPLKSLLLGMEGAEQVLAEGEAAPACEVQAPLLSLPGLLHTRVESIPAAPYLKAEVGRVQAWRAKIETLALADKPPLAPGKLKVGLVWAGNPEYPNDGNRSTVLETFGVLREVQGVRFFSLQKGAAAEQARRPPAGMELVDWTGELRDFADTAGLMEALDLVITVDTAAAHLAGAMGKRVWTVLALAADWRWLLGREDSPWYPSMRLFRQERPGDWAGVMERVGRELKGVANGLPGDGGVLRLDPCGE